MITKKMRLKDYKLTQDQIDILDSIEYNKQDEELLKAQIRKYLRNNYPIIYLKENWKEIVKLGKNSSSQNSFILRYGNKLGSELFQKKTNNCAATKEVFVKKYGEEEAKKRLSLKGASLENYIKRHGEELGREKWNNYLAKRKYTYKQGKEENRYESRNLEWFQKKHGIEHGYKVWDQKRKSQAYKVSKDYYIKKYGIEEGTKRCAASKTRSLENFIKKYGIEEGTKKYNTWVINVVSGLKNRRNYSVWSIECCSFIKEIITDLHYYAENEMIWQLPIIYQKKLNQKIISPDLFYRGKIIEFQGDLFHGNPVLFDPTEKVHPFNKNITVAELNQIDSIRREYYERKGYTVLEIWENDYKSNKEGVVEQCLTYLK